MKTICFARNPHFDESERFSLSKSILLANCSQLVATIPQRVPFASKSEDKSESTAESLWPAGSVSKFENDEEKRFDFTRSISDAKESISSALRSNTPPSISSNSL